MKQFLHSFFLLLVTLCIHLFLNEVTAQLRVQTGKSYINISKPTGGIIENGNQLEIRAVISVTGNSAYFVRYNDTIPLGTTYVANSIRFTTNEGMNYGTPLRPTGLLTDAGADDEARYNAGVLRVNLGSLTKSGGQTAAYNAVAAPVAIDVLPPASGCRIYNNGRPSFFGGTAIMMVTYRVVVNTLPGNSFIIPGGAFRYKAANTFSEATLPSTVRPLNRITVMVTDPLPTCSGLGLNSITGNGGNYGSGTTQNLSPAPAPGTVAPGYQWNPFAAPSAGPNDSMFTVANNTSTTGSTNSFLPYPNAARLFNLWDIIGDHTNAVNPVIGNPPATPGTVGGYMAVVNAAYGINNAVQQTVNGLCPDTYYEFSAWFRNICRRCSSDTSGKGSGTTNFKNYMAPLIPNTNDSAGVLPNLTFQVGGVDYYTTGNLDYNGQWVKKGFLFKTGPAQISANIVIRNNAPGGGGNDWVMDDVAFTSCLPGLNMRPSRSPSFCTNQQVRMSVVVTSFYNNYSYYQWERSTDGGVTWGPAPLAPAAQLMTYTYVAPDYKDTVAYPNFLATAATNGHKYRIRIASSLTNLSSATCAVYNSSDIITVTVNPVASCIPLPTEIINFNGRIVNEHTQLSWNAKQETNLAYYEVERSSDGVLFEKIATVPVSASNGSSFSQYSFTDPASVTGKMYYRLNMVASGDAGAKFSNIINVSSKESNQLEISNLVNPFDSNISFVLTAPQNEAIEILVKDITGRTIKVEKMQVMKGSNTVLLSSFNTLQKGSFIIQVKSASGLINKIIQKK
ncbi:MAG: hypothetical protein ABL872_16735 [Lacibacter sp.]